MINRVCHFIIGKICSFACQKFKVKHQLLPAHRLASSKLDKLRSICEKLRASSIDKPVVGVNNARTSFRRLIAPSPPSPCLESTDPPETRTRKSSAASASMDETRLFLVKIPRGIVPVSSFEFEFEEVGEGDDDDDDDDDDVVDDDDDDDDDDDSLVNSSSERTDTASSKNMAAASTSAIVC